MILKNQLSTFIFLIQIILFHKEVRSYSTGAGSCDAPSLQDHGNATEYNGEFELQTDSKTYNPSTIGVLTLVGNNGKKFKGFQIISEDISFLLESNDELIRFNNLTECNNNTRVTHTNNDEKEKVSIQFQLPKESKDFNITYYVVQDKKTWFGPLYQEILMSTNSSVIESPHEKDNDDDDDDEKYSEDDDDEKDNDDDDEKYSEDDDDDEKDNDDDEKDDDQYVISSSSKTGCEVSDHQYYACKAKLSNGFVLYWKHEELEGRRRKILQEDEDSLLEMALLAKTNGWIGFAFSEKSGEMFPADAIIGWINEDNSTDDPSQVFSYRITSYKIEGIQKNNNIGITPKSLTREDSNLFLEFTKNLKLGNIQSNTLDKDFNINYAIGSTHSLSEHTIKGSSTINLFHGHIKNTSSSKSAYKLHATLMILSWLLILPLGISVARSKWSFNLGQNVWPIIHLILQGFGAFLIVISFFIGIVKLDEAGTSGSKLHGVLGIITTLILMLHLILAIFRPKHGSDRRNLFNKVHHWTGRIVVVIAFVAILTGLNTYKEDHDGDIKTLVSFVVIFAFVQIIIAIFAEIWKMKNERNAAFNSTSGIGLGRIETIPDTK